MTSTKRIGFIGGGNMASAICHGIINKGLHKAENIWVAGPHIENLKRFKDHGINVTCDNGELVSRCDVVFLSTKPQYLKKAICDCKNSTYVKNSDSKLFVSILAGTTISKLKEMLAELFPNCRIIRVMPNTPMLLGVGVSVYTPDECATKEDLEFVKAMLGCCGIYEEVPENLIGAVGGLAGSGPAFVYLMIEALSDGGVKQGLSRPMATKFAAQTVLGAAKMVLETGKHPGELKDDVCSAGGSTICGIAALEKGCVRGAYMEAVEAAVRRSNEMGKED